MANIADNLIYFRVTTRDEMKAVHDFMEGNFESYSDPMGPDDDVEYPYQVEFNFDSKWGIPLSVLESFSEANPTISWNITSNEPGNGYMAMAYFDAHEDNWFEETRIQGAGHNLR